MRWFVSLLTGTCSCLRSPKACHRWAITMHYLTFAMDVFQLRKIETKINFILFMTWFHAHSIGIVVVAARKHRSSASTFSQLPVDSTMWATALHSLLSSIMRLQKYKLCIEGEYKTEDNGKTGITNGNWMHFQVRRTTSERHGSVTNSESTIPPRSR